jgi:GntR family transcriptional regulator/MocR family aminotransferase
MLDRQGDLTQEQMLSELIYEGEIHRLLKKNILVYKQRRDFLYQCLEENFKDAIRFKTNGRIGNMFNCNFNSTFRTSAMIFFLPKTILYQDKDTRYPFRLWPFE